jgi:hypothetical protein
MTMADDPFDPRSSFNSYLGWNNKLCHPNSPNGGGGPGGFRQAGPVCSQPNAADLLPNPFSPRGKTITTLDIMALTCGPVGLGTSSVANIITSLDDNTRKLAATAYGESSNKEVFEEMAAIANVLVRQQKARGYSSVSGFIQADTTFAFAAHDGNPRYTKLMAASLADINKDLGMTTAVKAAQNALSSSPKDYSNGAYFWDGADIKSNYDKHPKVKAGIHITDPAHNIYGIEDKDVPGEEWWKDQNGKKTKLRGSWKYKYESTAGYGGTIFWKYNSDFISTSGNKEYN